MPTGSWCSLGLLEWIGEVARLCAPGTQGCVLVPQSCPTLCDPMDWNPRGYSVHGILQARISEWVTIPFCRGSPQRRDQTQVSHIAGRFFTVWATWEAPELRGGAEKEAEWGLWPPLPPGQLHCQLFTCNSSAKVFKTVLFHFLKRFVLWCGPSLKSLLNLWWGYFDFMLSGLFFVWFGLGFFWHWHMWDLSSLTGDQTLTPCTGGQSLNHWTTREVPKTVLFL